MFRTPPRTTPPRTTASRTTASRLAVPALGALAALAVAAPAAADDAPTLAQQVGAAVTTSPETAGVPAGSYVVDDVRAAASDPTWAAAQLDPTDPAALDPATVVLHRVDGRWRVVSLGTAGVGCEETVPAVARDLALLC